MPGDNGAVRRGWFVGAVAAVALLSGCAASGVAAGPATTSPATSASPSPTAPSLGVFDPAASTDVFLPSRASAPDAGATVPVVVLVPGGGWVTHDRSGFAPLARQLADDGWFVVSTEYRAGQDGVDFPIPVQDVVCSAAYAAAQAQAAGYTPGRVVLVGHSAGGHLSALAAVSDGVLAGPCADPVPEIAGVAGLAGVYDTTSFAPVMAGFFGTPQSQDPALWASGDPVLYAEAGKAPQDLHVLLVHGDADELVPVAQSQTFATVLERAGIDVQLDVLPGETHMSVIRPDVVADDIDTWLRTWL
jgi:acetyl esterase/lipase